MPGECLILSRNLFINVSATHLMFFEIQYVECICTTIRLKAWDVSKNFYASSCSLVHYTLGKF